MERQMNLFALNVEAEVELVYKTKVKQSERPLVKSAKDCYELLSIIEREKLLLPMQRKFLFYNHTPFTEKPNLRERGENYF
ncbi:MAG TPA: hypothetical protein VIJ92_14755 [Ginsengibacter sp.]